MRHLTTAALLLATTALSTNAFGAGESRDEPVFPPLGQGQGPGPAPTGLPDIFGNDPNHGTVAKFNFEIISDNEFSLADSFPGDANGYDIQYVETFLDNPRSETMDNGLQYSHRIVLDEDVSFTGSQRLRAVMNAEDQPGASTLLETPEKFDYMLALPAFNDARGMPDTQPILTARLRDEIAVGVKIGYEAEFGDLLSLRRSGGPVDDVYDNLPSDGITLRIEPPASSRDPGFHNTVSSSDYGRINVQVNTSGGPAFPNLLQGNRQGTQTWPPGQDVPDSGGLFYTSFPTNNPPVIPPGTTLFGPAVDTDAIVVGTIRKPFQY